jgi:hypothetical protein
MCKYNFIGADMKLIHSTSAALILVIIVLLSYGCENRAHVIITGKVPRWGKRDTMFVSLTKNWESIRLAPDRFEILRNGEFELEFTTGRNPPPVTFIRNREAYAVLTINNLDGPSPMIVDEMRNKMAELKLENGVYRVRIDLK